MKQRNKKETRGGSGRGQGRTPKFKEETKTVSSFTYNGVTYNMNEWTSPTRLAIERGYNPSYYRKIIYEQERGIGNRSVEFIRIPELDLVLVKR